MATVQYDPKIIVAFAERLYAQANRIVALYAILGAAIGGSTGASVAAFAFDGQGTVSVIVGLVIGALPGALLGQERAFVLRLQAQTALCQMQIETNTRGGGPGN